MNKRLFTYICAGFLGFTFWAFVNAAEESEDELRVIEATAQPDTEIASSTEEEKAEGSGPVVNLADLPQYDTAKFDPLKYTLGPDDVIEVTIFRHPEFSGVFPVNLEGKVQYKYVGDIEVTGLTKKELEDKIASILSKFVISPQVDVTIKEFRSKFVFVLGEVGAPGRYYMRSEVLSVRDAVVEAGLPTYSAAMRRCQLITPGENGRQKMRYVDVYSVLYGGNLSKNIDMLPGEVLYVPATVMAKIIRIISPVSTTVGLSSSMPEGTSRARSALTNFSH